MIWRKRICDICKASEDQWSKYAKDPSALQIKVAMFSPTAVPFFSDWQRIDVCPDCAKVIGEIATKLREQNKKETTTA